MSSYKSIFQILPGDSKIINETHFTTDIYENKYIF